MEYVIVLLIAVIGLWWYYNKRLNVQTRKDLENYVKVDVKEVKAEAEVVVAKVQEQVKKRTAKKKKKTDNE